MLSLKFRDFELPHLRLIRFGPFLGAGIFVVNGAHWEHSRAMLRPSFTRAQVADLDIFERHVSEVIDAIPKDGSMVDLQQLFFDLTLDTSTEFLFGESANTLVDRMAGKTGDDNFSDSFTNCMQWIGDRIRLGYFVGRQGDKYRRSHKFVHDFADRYVQQALEHHRAVQSGAIPDETEKADGRYVFLWELAKQTQDPVVLRSEALNILLAGRDTTASLLSCLWHILSRRPDVWTKLLAEVDQLEERRPTFEEMKSMKYLRFCLNESESFSHSFYLSITNFSPLTSPPHPPRRPRKQPRRSPRHSPPARRRARREIANLCEKGPVRAVQRVLDASPRGPLRARRRRVQAGAVGDHPARLGVSAVQRGSEDLSWP